MPRKKEDFKGLSRYDTTDVKILKIIKEINLQLSEISQKIHFSDVNPYNILEEKQKVMKDRSYNPVFKYFETEYDLKKLLNELLLIDIKKANKKYNNPFLNILGKKQTQLVNKILMLTNRGNNKEFTKYSKLIYGCPDSKLIKKAEFLLEIKKIKTPRTISTEQAINLLKAEITHYGFDYDIKGKIMSASADVADSKKRIYIQANSKFSENFINRLMVHEIATHILRAENGKLQPFEIFAMGFPNYLTTEEGLAVFNEERFDVLGSYMKIYGARTIAISLALKKGFSYIYNYFLDFFGKERAFKLALRAKRGCSDTSKPGSCTKDHIYLKGYYDVKRYVEKGNDINYLYYGKISVDDVEMVKEIEDIYRLKKPVYLPQATSFKRLTEF